VCFCAIASKPRATEEEEEEEEEGRKEGRIVTVFATSFDSLLMVAIMM
jgi:hypothetical protein